jgi:hypothetical protein
MENELEDMLRIKMSIDILEIETPDVSFISAARKRVSQRKKPVSNWQMFADRIFSAFCFQNKAYHFVLTSLIIIGCIFYFSRPDSEPLKILKNNNYTGKTGSITSSTILATNDEHPQKKPSVNTSTALTSIITFVTIN